MRMFKRVGCLLAVLATVGLSACGGGGGGEASGSGSRSNAGTADSGSGSGAGSGSGGGSGTGSGGGVVPRPTPPWTLGIQAVAQRGLRLSWAAVPGATGYEIALDPDDSDGANAFVTQQTLADGAATSYTFNNLRLVDALRYTYRVRACVDGVCSQAAQAPVKGTLQEAADVVVGSGLQSGEGFGWVMSTASATVSNTSGANAVHHWLAVGAPGAGKVLVYQRLAGSSQWSAVASLSNATTDPKEFGTSVAFSPNGEWLAVGVPGDNAPGSGVMKPDAAPSGPLLNNAGAVRIYRRAVESTGRYTWRLFENVKAFNPGAGDRFGSAVTINDNGYLVVGAPFEDSASFDAYPASAADAVFADATDGTQDQGAVYLYWISATTPPGSRMLSYLKPRNPLSAVRFGSRLAFSNTGVLAVGAPRASALASNAGAVALYGLNFSTGLFAYHTSIGPDPDEAVSAPTDEGFGASLSLNKDGTLLAVGHPAWSQGPAGDKAGAAYVYERVGDLADPRLVWRLQQSFAAPTPYAFNRFGKSVQLLTLQASRLDVPRSMLLVGHWGDSAAHLGLQRSGAYSASAGSGGYGNTGGAFCYEGLQGVWVDKARLKAPGIDLNSNMGLSVAITQDGSELLMGAQSATAVIGY